MSEKEIFEDEEHWAARADEAMRTNNWMGSKKSKEFLDRLLNDAGLENDEITCSASWPLWIYNDPDYIHICTWGKPDLYSAWQTSLEIDRA